MKKTAGIKAQKTASLDRAEGLSPAAKSAHKKITALFDRALAEATQQHSNLERGESFRSDKPVDHLRDEVLDIHALGGGTPKQDAVALKGLLDNLPRTNAFGSKLTYALSRHFTAAELTQVDALAHDFAKARGLTAELSRLGYSEPMPIDVPTRLDQGLAAGYATKQAGARWRG
jgi:hypothetical protein